MIKRFIYLTFVLLILAACGQDEDKKDETNKIDIVPTALPLPQAISTFGGAVTFNLPADAMFNANEEESRYVKFELSSGVVGFIVWGPLPAGITPDADGLAAIFQAGGGQLLNGRKYEINGNLAIQAEGDYRALKMGYGYVVGVLTNGQVIQMTFASPTKALYDSDKSTILAIVDTVSVDGDKLPLVSTP